VEVDTRHWIGGERVKSKTTFTDISPIDEQPIAEISAGSTLEVDAAVEAGADLCGFILAPESPRAAAAVLDVPETALSVAVLVGEMQDAGADLVQLYPREEGRVRGRDAVLLRNGNQVATVIDLPWTEDDPSHLDRARATEGRVMLAGGLGPENVRAAIEAVRPWAVDASSSLETAPGIKDHVRVRAFVEAAR
jgi:phosphoribosylanthranilate isomerase